MLLSKTEMEKKNNKTEEGGVKLHTNLRGARTVHVFAPTQFTELMEIKEKNVDGLWPPDSRIPVLVRVTTVKSPTGCLKTVTLFNFNHERAAAELQIKSATLWPHGVITVQIYMGLHPFIKVSVHY